MTVPINNSSRSSILLIEFDLSGHRLQYINSAAHAFMEDGYDVVVIAPSTVSLECVASASCTVRAHSLSELSCWRSKSKSYRLRKLLRLSGMIRSVGDWLLMRDIYRELSKSYRLSAVFIPYFDYLVNSMALFGSPFGLAHVGGIVMNQTWHLKSVGIKCSKPTIGSHLRKVLFKRAIRDPTIKKLFSLDEELVECLDCEKLGHLEESIAEELHELFSSTGPISEWTRGRMELEIVAVGVMGRRKNIVNFLDAAVKARQEYSISVKVKLLGSFHAEYLHEIKKSESYSDLSRLGLIELEDRKIDLDRMARALLSADAIWLCYVAHFTSSGILPIANAANRPVLASDEGLIGFRTSRDRCGISCSPRSVQAITTAMVKLAQRNNQFEYPVPPTERVAFRALSQFSTGI